MKKLATLITVLTFNFSLSTFDCNAQVPQGINYQAVARDAAGNILANQNICVDLNITNGNGGPAVYAETANLNTNQFGLFTIKIGNSDPAAFATIIWSSISPWINPVIDIGCTANPISMGSSQLLSVPYAMYAAATSENDPKVGTLSIGSVPRWNGTALENSLITDNGTNVGINNSSPVQKLDVGGAINIADASTTSDGAIRYHNQDFEGYTLGQWVSLMKNSYRNIDFGNPFVTNVRNTWDYATDTAVVGESGYYFVMFNITDATPGGPYDPTTGDYDASVQTALFYKRGANPLAPVVYGVPFFHPLIDVTPTGNILRYIIDTGGISAVSLLEAGDILSAGMRITTNGFPIGNVAFSYTATLVKIAPY